jgi:hypothetical protein
MTRGADLDDLVKGFDELPRVEQERLAQGLAKLRSGRKGEVSKRKPTTTTSAAPYTSTEGMHTSVRKS